MIDIEKTKKLLGNPNISDEEAEQIRDECYALADIVIETLLEKIKNKNTPDRKSEKDKK